MGCDISLAIEERVEDGWAVARELMLPDDYRPGHMEFFGDRNYILFGALAGVRSDAVPPIHEMRGLPDDASDEGRDMARDEYGESWASVRELLAYDWCQTFTREGVVNAVEYCRWRDHKRPQSWCVSIAGRSIQNVTNVEMQVACIGHRWHEKDELAKRAPGWHTRVEWEDRLDWSCGTFVALIARAARRALSHHDGDMDRVRFIYGFG